MKTVYDRIAALEAERDNAIDGRQRAHAAANRVVKRAIAERDDQRRRAEAAEREWNVTGGLLGACEKERDELHAELARLRDDVEEVIALLSDTEHTDDYVACTAGKHLLDIALNPEDLPFDAPTISDHAPDVTHERSGIDPLAVTKVEG